MRIPTGSGLLAELIPSAINADEVRPQTKRADHVELMRAGSVGQYSERVARGGQSLDCLADSWI